MKTFHFGALLFLTAISSLSANEPATQAARIHLENLLRGNFDELAKTYAPEVILTPGHEFLKPEYGLANDGGRDTAAKVDRSKLIEAMRKASEGRPERPDEKIEAMLENLKYEPLKTTVGDFSTGPSDPTGTSDGKLHFEIEKGDVLLKVFPPKGDFLLFHLRDVDGQWKVVAEYLD